MGETLKKGIHRFNKFASPFGNIVCHRGGGRYTRDGVFGAQTSAHVEVGTIGFDSNLLQQARWSEGEEVENDSGERRKRQ